MGTGNLTEWRVGIEATSLLLPKQTGIQRYTSALVSGLVELLEEQSDIKLFLYFHAAHQEADSDLLKSYPWSSSRVRCRAYHLHQGWLLVVLPIALCASFTQRDSNSQPTRGGCGSSRNTTNEQRPETARRSGRSDGAPADEESQAQRPARGRTLRCHRQDSNLHALGGSSSTSSCRVFHSTTVASRGLGFEPRSEASKASVLPLNDPRSRSGENRTLADVRMRDASRHESLR